MCVELGRDVRDLIELLNRHGVRYLAVGGFAGAAGAPTGASRWV